ncbi:uncharacterized protein BXZ73DRAFT_77868 [Epithele typhae]|uniref:uncharacterized protein n=1 Tax=Epithele typhae TaxID=378194 RepID=UPI0020077CED|nr:uncharacterized protein BXZ73DRAFT_77868 [Epithele typhae]KAH9930417.1 hypothetical protein BXZ73DRAFT_77868 [Epithele typhae]
MREPRAGFARNTEYLEPASPQVTRLEYGDFDPPIVQDFTGQKVCGAWRRLRQLCRHLEVLADLNPPPAACSRSTWICRRGAPQRLRHATGHFSGLLPLSEARPTSLCVPIFRRASPRAGPSWSPMHVSRSGAHRIEIRPHEEDPDMTSPPTCNTGTEYLRCAERRHRPTPRTVEEASVHDSIAAPTPRELEGDLFPHLRTSVVPLSAPASAAAMLRCVYFAWPAIFAFLAPISLASAAALSRVQVSAPESSCGSTSTDGHLLAKRDTSGVFVCIDIDWGGDCTTIHTPLNQCMQFDEQFSKQVSSMRSLDEQTDCDDPSLWMFDSTGHSDGGIPDVPEGQGGPTVDQLELDFNDQMTAFECWNIC